MMKIDNQLQPLNVSIPLRADLGPARRLMVPVLDPEADPTTLTQRVWELANATGSQVKFLGLCQDTTQEQSLRRTLAIMTAMVNYGTVAAESEVIPGKDWVEILKSRVQSGDMVVLWEEPRTKFLRRPMSQLLQSRLDVPLYVLSGLSGQTKSNPGWLSHVAAWAGSMAIIIGFFMLQVEIEHLAKSWSVVLELLSIAVEFRMIWLWNSLFR